MRNLVAALLILATPFSALAGGRWREDRGAPEAVYGPGPGRQMGPPRGPVYGGPAYYGPPPMRQGPYGPPPAVYAAPPRDQQARDQQPRDQQARTQQARTQQERAREAVRAGRRVPLPYVIEHLRHKMGAEYVDAREVNDPSGRPMYVVRFRQRGRYIDVPVDAETGAVQ